MVPPAVTLSALEERGYIGYYEAQAVYDTPGYGDSFEPCPAFIDGPAIFGKVHEQSGNAGCYYRYNR